jgi:hypothetical protein
MTFARVTLPFRANERGCAVPRYGAAAPTFPHVSQPFVLAGPRL